MKKYFLYASALFAIALVIGIIMQQPSLYKPCALATAISLAIGLGAVPSLKGYQYTAWIISAVVAGMIFPEAFKNWGGVNLRDKTLILVIIQLVMFGMGTHMSLKDFSGLASTGKGVAVGLFCHFSIMPLMGLLLTKVFHFEPEIAAGIILIGSCSSGLGKQCNGVSRQGQLSIKCNCNGHGHISCAIINTAFNENICRHINKNRFCGYDDGDSKDCTGANWCCAAP